MLAIQRSLQWKAKQTEAFQKIWSNTHRIYKKRPVAMHTGSKPAYPINIRLASCSGSTETRCASSASIRSRVLFLRLGGQIRQLLQKGGVHMEWYTRSGMSPNSNVSGVTQGIMYYIWTIWKCETWAFSGHIYQQKQAFLFDII
jgi:hypothetical protein